MCLVNKERLPPFLSCNRNKKIIATTTTTTSKTCPETTRRLPKNPLLHPPRRATISANDTLRRSHCRRPNSSCVNLIPHHVDALEELLDLFRSDPSLGQCRPHLVSADFAVLLLMWCTASPRNVWDPACTISFGSFCHRQVRHRHRDTNAARRMEKR